MTWGQSLAASIIVGGAIVFGAVLHGTIMSGSQRAWDEKVWDMGTISYTLDGDGVVTAHTITGRPMYVTRNYARGMAGFPPEGKATSAVPGRTLPR